MKLKGTALGRGLLVALIALVVAGLGFALGAILTAPQSARLGDMAAVDGGAEAPAPQADPGTTGSGDTYGKVGAPDVPALEEQGDAASRSSASPDSDAMVIRTASMEVRVRSVEPALRSVRAAARRNDAEVSDLSVQSGTGGPVQPLAEPDASSFPSPATATVTLRVPADKLEALQEDIADIGVVLSQSASASDVTEEYVDLAARLKNLKAEEARLRSFFDRAGKVSELLAVERELARVRGEIESMQAQLDYLERQVARATLTVTLIEPDEIVSPGGSDWGFLEAVRIGIRGAAAVIRTTITGLIALTPVFVIAALVWLVVRLLQSKRRRDSEDVRPEDTD